VYSPKQIQNNQGILISNILIDNSRLNSSIVLPMTSGLYDHDAEGICYITHMTRLINNNKITNFQGLLNNEIGKVNDNVCGVFNEFLNFF